jgi:cell wall-associated NlpC family hydrolase
MRAIPPLSAPQRTALVAAARSLVGTPFRHQGRTRRGCDCIGLLVLSFALIGLRGNDRVDYGKLPAHRKLAASLEDNFGLPFSGELQPGDVVAMSWGAEEAHVALVCDHPDLGLGLIHSYANAGRVIEHGLIPEHIKLITLRFRP